MIQEFKAKNKSSKSIYYLIIIIISAIALSISAILNSSILALIGLGLLFWGLLLSFIHTDDYVKKTILDATTATQIIGVNELLKELDYSYTPIYLPPRFFKSLETSKIWVSKNKNGKIPTPSQMNENESRFFFTEPAGILMTAPGTELMQLFEKMLDTNFIKVNISYLLNNLPKLIVNDLEFTNSFKINRVDNSITVDLETFLFQFDIENRQETENRFASGIPLCSAIACSLTRVTGKPIIIKKQQFNEDGKSATVIFSILNDIYEDYEPLETVPSSVDFKERTDLVEIDKAEVIALVDERKVALEVVGAIKDSNAAPNTSDTVSSPTIAQTSADKVKSGGSSTQAVEALDEAPDTVSSPVIGRVIEEVELNPATVQTTIESDKTVIPLAKSSKKGKLFVLSIAVTIGLLVYANVVALNLISLPEYSMYLGIAGAVALTVTTVAIVLVDKLRGAASKSHATQIIDQVKESNEIAYSIPSTVTAEEAFKITNKTPFPILLQANIKINTETTMIDEAEQEKQLLKKHVFPTIKVICPACRKEFSLPNYEKDFIVNFGPTKQSNLIKSCPYCETTFPLKRKGDQEDIWKE